MKDVNAELEEEPPIWCSTHGRWECDEEHETNVQRFDREQGLDQESAASWRKRWEAELADKAARKPHPYWCWCDDCKERD